MKALRIILILTFYNTASSAQTKFTEGVTKGKLQNFEVERGKTDFEDKHPLFIHSNKNKYKTGIPRAKNNYQIPILKSDIHVDTSLVKQIVRNVLKDKIKELHNKGETLNIRLVFETTGLLTDTNYTATENSIITPTDIENMDITLRQKIKASFTGRDYTYHVAVNYNFPIISF